MTITLMVDDWDEDYDEDDKYDNDNDYK